MANLKRNNDMAVSPVVATLVLIVVAVIGAVAVGTIMGTFSSDVSKKASAGQAGDAAASEILIAGSTTCIPAELNLANDYSRQNPGFQINVQGGGSAQGPQSVALGIADIGATSSASAITTAMNNNANDPIYQNLYFTQIGGRGVVFIQDSTKAAVPTNVVSAGDLLAAYTDANLNKGKTTTANGNVTGPGSVGNVTMVQREAGSGTMSTAFSWIGGAAKTAKDTGFANLSTQSSNAAMLTAVKAGTATAPAVGFVDSGYAISGGLTSTTTAPGISIMNVVDSTAPTAGYAASHANIKAALKDWYYANAQGTNYPQGLVGGLYWVTKGSSPSSFNGNVVVEGKSTAGSAVTGLISFAKSPVEAAAFNNVGMYSMYDFIN